MTKSKYWKCVRIDAAGNRQILEIAPAKAFFASAFGEFPSNNDVPSDDIQQQLLRWIKDAANSQRLLAERCLLCFISWQIDICCLQLETQFGAVHGFTRCDLLPYVLDDDGSLQPPTFYNSFSREILQSFDPEQSSLTTWTSRRVKQHPALNRFLLECGVYIVSDWAILNDTQPKQLQRILGEFYLITPVEIKRSQQLLEAYHAVYRADRLQKRSLGIRGQCTTPTTQQLQQICQRLEDKTNQKVENETAIAQLQNLANRLRQYRIHVRGGFFPTESLDAAGNQYNTLLERISSPDVNSWDQEEQVEFLESYRPQFQACLDQALTMVIESRVRQLQRKDDEKARKFLTALHLSHCEKVSMAEIAVLLGLRAQDAVTRLLKLKEFRADVQQQLLVILRSRVIELAKNYSTTERLASLEGEITLALNEQITLLISQAEAEAQSAKNTSYKTHFTERLCKQLKIYSL
jgi:HPt (histidine-containing phosphotransfer) domain-containing protein